MGSLTVMPRKGLSPRVRGNPTPEAACTKPKGSIPACAGEPPASARWGGICKVYPRVCGGTRQSPTGTGQGIGLSPRVRGNPELIPFSSPRKRSIPACAGEPDAAGGYWKATKVYPRVCGGTSGGLVAAACACGLSPRVRGNRGRQHGRVRVRRSIPACAGEPWRFSSKPAPDAVYPRVCGGTHQRKTSSLAGMGLSPRVRGNRGDSARNPRRTRSIPACAGEPRPSILPPSRVAVYPRVCGGTGTLRRHYQTTPGLSPRVRGNRQRLAAADMAAGSIPACAGEPRARPVCGDTGQVYPRVCGGTHGAANLDGHPVGLSPRVRGNPGAGVLQSPANGSIPACAGEPCRAGNCARCGEVYPRVCGGTRCCARPRGSSDGLSPRVRGNPSAALRTIVWWRSIPACAGEPARFENQDVVPKVYPRVCGGTLRRRSEAGRCRGSIPACAGEPRAKMPRYCSRAVYPRVCGGTIGVCALRYRHNGLSPRVRGNRRSLLRQPPGCRSIPACAGEPWRVRLFWLR